MNPFFNANDMALPRSRKNRPKLKGGTSAPNLLATNSLEYVRSGVIKSRMIDPPRNAMTKYNRTRNKIQKSQYKIAETPCSHPSIHDIPAIHDRSNALTKSVRADVASRPK